MARIENLDFRQFIEEREAARAHDGPAGEAGAARKGSRAHDYAYSSDQATRATFEQLKPLELAIAAAVRAFKQVNRAQMLGSAVKVGPRQFPRVHGLASDCAATLGIATPTLYIVNSPTANAATYGTNDDAFILVHSRLIDHFTDDELKAVIGHECGHIHNNHVVYLTAMHYLANVAGLFLQAVGIPAMLALKAWSRRAEVTCDRAAALCVRDAAIIERALAKLALGSVKLYDELDVDAFLEQHAEGHNSPGRFLEALASHPWLPKRILALRAFTESRLYRRHVGAGEDGLAMREVDERVHELVQLVGPV